MTPDRKASLAAQHLPILWLHEREAFYPLDCNTIFAAADLCENGRPLARRRQPQSFADPRFNGKTDDFSFRFRGLDMANFVTSPRRHHRHVWELGPGSVAHAARRDFGGAFGQPDFGPKCYARVTLDAELSRNQIPSFPPKFRRRQRHLAGRYHHIEYFFYYLFNDSWNLHESDWDSMVELFVDKESPRVLMVTHLHHCLWLSQWGKTPTNFAKWCDEWNGIKETEIGTAYVLNGHPFIFIAKGAHGAYPTPGFSLHGTNLPLSDDFLADTDERVIGRVCICPDDVPQAAIEKQLRRAKLRTDQLDYRTWRECELVRKQPWTRFRGKWGSDTSFTGFDAPEDPPVTKDPDIGNLLESYGQGYDGGGIFDILRNWHGVRPMDRA